MTLIVFDIDDTLYLERDYVKSGFRAVGDYLRISRGIAEFSGRAWELFLGGRRNDVFDAVLVELGVEPSTELIKTLVHTYRQHRPEISLLEDALLALRSAFGEGASIGVVTDGPAASQWQKVQALDLGAWTDDVVVTEDQGSNYHKPSPLAFQLLQRRLSERPSSCCYIGDNPRKDFAGPKQLGWFTVRLRRPGSLQEAVCSGVDVDLECEVLSTSLIKSLVTASNFRGEEVN